MAAGDDALRRKIGRVAFEWIKGSHPPDPSPDDLPSAVPDLGRPPDGQVTVTWVGHATVLLRLPGLTLLTDPHWSARCSPVSFAGARRFVPPGVPWQDLPPVHAVLLSHDHYDHLDRPTVKALRRRFGDGLSWLTPLGYRRWFRRLGITRVTELDWWDAAELPGGYRVVALPKRHWTRRTAGGLNRRLWSGWAVLSEGDRQPRVYFAGDSAYCPAFAEIGERIGPFDVSLIPIGAYEPRWFMGASHMNPEEAVQAYADAGGTGAFVPIHWGTWRLTFEDPLEPPVRVQAAWDAAGHTPEDLRILRHGESVTVARARFERA